MPQTRWKYPHEYYRNVTGDLSLGVMARIVIVLYVFLWGSDNDAPANRVGEQVRERGGRDIEEEGGGEWNERDGGWSTESIRRTRCSIALRLAAHADQPHAAPGWLKKYPTGRQPLLLHTWWIVLPQCLLGLLEIWKVALRTRASAHRESLDVRIKTPGGSFYTGARKRWIRWMYIPIRFPEEWNIF